MLSRFSNPAILRILLFFTLDMVCKDIVCDTMPGRCKKTSEGDLVSCIVLHLVDEKVPSNACITLRRAPSLSPANLPSQSWTNSRSLSDGYGAARLRDSDKFPEPA